MEKSTEALRAILKAIKSKDAASERTYDPAKQVEGYKKRIEGSGLDVEKETDERNLIEKFFNLPEDQNPLFDFFEVINRPQQALFGGIKESQEGGSFLEGAKSGLSGKDYTHFKDILNSEGITEETEGRLGLDDVLGFAGDVFLDPMNIMLPTTAGRKIIKATDKLADANKALSAAQETIQGIENGIKAMESAKDFNAAASKLQVDELFKAKEIAEEGLKPLVAGVDEAQKGLDAANKLVKKRSGAGYATHAIGSGIRGTFSLADSAITGILTKADANWLKYAKSTGVDVSNKVPALTGYQNLKTTFTNTFNYVKSMPAGLFESARKVRGKQALSRKQMYTILEDSRKGIYTKADEFVNIYNSKNPILRMDRESFLENIVILYEGGSNVFDAAGKVTRKGLNRTTTYRSLLNDDDVLIKSGMTQQDAEKVENFVKTYFPDWYDSNITQQKASLFKVTASTEGSGIVDQYRFNNKDILKSLRTEISGVKNSTSHVVVGKTKLTKAQMAEEDALKENLDAYKEAKKHAEEYGKTNQIALKIGSKKHTKYMANYERIKAIDVDRRKIIAKMQRLVNGGEYTQMEADKLLKQIKDSGDEMRRLVAENLSLNKNYSEDINKLIAEAQEKYDNIIKNHMKNPEDITGEDFWKVYSPEHPDPKKLDPDIADNFNKNSITMRHFFSDERVKQLEEFAQSEGVDTILDMVHEFMTRAGQMINDTMDAGLKIDDGYLAHAITPEWEALRLSDMAVRTKDKTWASTRDLLGNPEAMGSRRYKMSIAEANEVAKGYVQSLIDDPNITNEAFKAKLRAKKELKMFATELNSSFVNFIEKAPKAVGDSMILHEVIAKSFDPSDNGKLNTKYIMPLDNKEFAPRGYTEVTVEALQAKTNAMRKYIKDNPANKDLLDKVDSYLKANAGQKVAIDNNINNLIGRITDKKGQNEILKMTDYLTGVFKKNKLLSPGFQMRNVVGNISNMWLSGMPLKDVLSYNLRAHKALKKGQELLVKITKEGGASKLSVDDAKILTSYVEFVEHGFGEMGNKLMDIPEHLWNIHRKATRYKSATARINDAATDLRIAKMAKDPDPAFIKSLEGTLEAVKKEVASDKALGYPKHLYDELVAFNMRGNQAQDANFRMAVFMYSKDNPEFLSKFSYGSPQDAVRKILFDHMDLSETERDVMRKIIPFYTFTKKNLAFQISNLDKNAQRYNKLIKAFNSTWDTLDLDANELDKFKVENFWLPIPGIREDGKYVALKTSLPLGDLGEWLDDPFRRALSSTSPIVRAPFEIALNRQVFSNMPIQEFKGQKGFQIPELSRTAEFGINQLGLDVPVAQAFDIGRTAVQGYKGEIDNVGEALQGAFGRTVSSISDPVATAERNAYEDLDDMQNLMRYYKQEGINILTLSEIENQGKFKSQKQIIERIRAIRNR